ncbi:CDP-archaeol synthase [Paenibacillus lentus]|uniref:CDP-archaeol synthase n=1 Tax=Paenibacillus lentus TaxID=1338368 RepID=UPI003661CD4B
MLSMLVTAVPIISATICNMFFLKTPWFQALNKPMDNYKTLQDGKRLFGNNKTWRGFWGMVFFSALCCVLWGFIGQLSPAIESYNLLYAHYSNNVVYNIIIGGLLGIAYGVFELPNSYLKRRIGIQPGKSKYNAVGILFIIVDQIDSLIGCILVLSLVYPMSFIYYMAYVILGGIVHISLSSLFYFMKLRKNF